MAIHPTAVISSDAEIGSGVEIGPYSVIGHNCRIGDGCRIDTHVKIAPYTTIGSGTSIYMGALIGEEPQDHRFHHGIKSRTEIGCNTVVREYVTVHRSPFEGGVTRVGDSTLLMAFVHLGHDCNVGNRVTIANQTAVSGHVIIEDGAVLSGYILIHQFCRIGSLAMIGARTLVRQDIPPFCMLAENGCICGPNTIGMRRAGFSPELRNAIRTAIKIYFFHGLNSSNALDEITGHEKLHFPEITHFVEFIRSGNRGIMPGDAALAALCMRGTAQKEEEDL